MKKILMWIKSHILIMITMIISIIVLCILIFNNVPEKEKFEDERYITMICSNEYEDGEKVKLEFIYDFVGKNLKKHVLNHMEKGLNEEDEWFCNRFDLLPGISCSFDNFDAPQQYTIEFNMNELNDESREIINEYGNYSDFLSLSMVETKKYLIEDGDYNGMVCKIIDENGNLISEEKNDGKTDEIESEGNSNETSYEKYIGKYYDTANPSDTDVHTIELKANGTYNAWVNFGISSSEVSGTYTIDDNVISLSSSNDGEYYKISKTVFIANDNRLTFKSGGISDETANNIGCLAGNFDCTTVKIFYKK